MNLFTNHTITNPVYNGNVLMKPWLYTRKYCHVAKDDVCAGLCHDSRGRCVCWAVCQGSSIHISLDIKNTVSGVQMLCLPPYGSIIKQHNTNIEINVQPWQFPTPHLTRPSTHKLLWNTGHYNGLEQACRKYSSSAIVLLQSCAKPLIWYVSLISSWIMASHRVQT